MMKGIVIIVCVILFPFFMPGQSASAQKRPMWLRTPFSDKEVHNSYFDCAIAEGSNEVEVRENAVATIIRERYRATGLNVHIQKDGSIIILDSDLTVKARCLDEYIERIDFNKLKISVLVQIANHPDSVFDPVRVSEDYPFSPRVFLPGMEQIYKGSVTKGVLFIAGEAVAVGGIVAFESLRATKKSKFNQTHDVAARRKYNDDADRMRNLRNGCIVGAAAIYLWNVIDGCVARGGRRLWVGKCDMKVIPVAMNQGAGVSFVLNF